MRITATVKIYAGATYENAMCHTNERMKTSMEKKDDFWDGWVEITERIRRGSAAMRVGYYRHCSRSPFLRWMGNALTLRARPEGINTAVDSRYGDDCRNIPSGNGCRWANPFSSASLYTVSVQSRWHCTVRLLNIHTEFLEINLNTENVLYNRCTIN
jgi:hypothetical protein